MSVEDLLNIEVTSVSKTEQKLSQTASAIYVITQEDIRRSGADSSAIGHGSGSTGINAPAVPEAVESPTSGK